MMTEMQVRERLERYYSHPAGPGNVIQGHDKCNGEWCDECSNPRIWFDADTVRALIQEIDNLRSERSLIKTIAEHGYMGGGSGPDACRHISRTILKSSLLS